MRRRITRCLLIGLFVLVIINQSAAWTCACTATAQESTQLLNKVQLIKQLAEQIQMVKNQYQMLMQLSGSLKSGLAGANSQIMSQFEQVQDIWKEAESLTHSMDDFLSKHIERHPEQHAGEEVNAELARRKRDKEYAEMLKSYLEGLNMQAQDFEDRANTRQKLFDTLSSTEGQVQAIQALGGLINHTSSMIDQQTEVMAGFTTMFAENELDKRDQLDNALKNRELALDQAKNEPTTGRGYRPKSQW